MVKKLKKGICLVLSCALIFLNGQVFAQDASVSDIVSQADIDELTLMSKKIKSKYIFSRNHAASDEHFVNLILERSTTSDPYQGEKMIRNSLNKFHQNLEELETELTAFQTKLRATYQQYIDALPEGTYLREATQKYITKRMDELFERQNFVLGKMMDLSNLVQDNSNIVNMSAAMNESYFSSKEARLQALSRHYTQDTRTRNLFLADLAEQQAYYDKLFTWDIEKLLDQLEVARTSFSRETVQFFSKRNHTVEEVMEYFAAHGPQEQKALQFAVRTTDRGLTTTHLINYLRYYLKHTNRRLWKMERYSAPNLARTLSGMSFERRVDFIDNTLDFAPEIKALRAEFRTAEQQAGRRLLDRGSIKLSGTFIVIAAPLIALTVTAVTANNVHRSNIQKLAETKNKIDNRDIISLDEMFDYYTNERNISRGQENLEQLAETFEAIRATNALMDASALDLSLNENDLQEEMGYLEQEIPGYLNEDISNLNFADITSQINELRI